MVKLDHTDISTTLRPLKMANRLILFLTGVFLIAASLGASIEQVRDLKRLEEEIRRLPRSALVVFDVDNTLLTPKDLSLKPCGQALRQLYLHPLSPKKREQLQSIIGLEAEEMLMDAKFPALIKQLQKAGVPVMALTALETGEYGKIRDSESWRLSRLRQFDLNFKPSFANNVPMTLTEIHATEGHYPTFKDGVLFSNRHCKGDVLIAFLDRIGLKPTVILFMDDTLKQLESVQSAAAARGIPFTGLHYVASTVVPADYDPELGAFQFQYLVVHEQWLSDAAARKVKTAALH